MFDRFTDRARKVMGLARQEAQRFNHQYIGSMPQNKCHHHTHWQYCPEFVHRWRASGPLSPLHRVPPR